MIMAVVIIKVFNNDNDSNMNNDNSNKDYHDNNNIQSHVTMCGSDPIPMPISVFHNAFMSAVVSFNTKDIL